MISANDLASVIISRSGAWVDAMSLQKLLYYVQSWHLAITDEPLFEERIKAWKDGPVVPQVWHERREPWTRRPALQHVGDVQLDDFASDLVDMVLRTYGSMRGDELSALTHAESPWIEARGDLPEDAHSSEEVSTESMARFYRDARRLGGRTAADLAAGGLHIQASEHCGPVDVDQLLRELGEGEPTAEASPNPWGSANLEDGSRFDASGIETRTRHTAVTE